MGAHGLSERIITVLRLVKLLHFPNIYNPFFLFTTSMIHLGTSNSSLVSSITGGLPAPTMSRRRDQHGVDLGYDGFDTEIYKTNMDAEATVVDAPLKSETSWWHCGNEMRRPSGEGEAEHRC